ncbi:NADP-dependent oxidoreductase [Rhodococcus indonesiensis]|uniref:NADP-dependent oxidoreductase n=1 Tax=Rhodococcus indonesiensis TaxID=3055869 RepID=A0ABT7RQE6_9NOCA|nr:NADP-dependent oxidoreductase [Rhodococcus indonesiensis]MDM7489864.1 NADP-dependent oxidoreductase [Rhodococcus indonesiensis]
MVEQNVQVRMRRHPEGMVTEDDFDIVSVDVPVPGPGEAVVKTHYLSLDPYMRPMMDPLRSYVPHLNPGDLMPGAAVGEIVESNEPSLPVGSIVTGMLGWQTHGIVTPGTCRIVDTEAGPTSAALHVLGMTGATAHYGLLELAKPRAGETVVVTAASGAVGSVVGQIAKIRGARTIGIAGGPEKCRYVREELGFDECLDHRAPDFLEQLAAATPDYVDVLFENVGGPIFDAVLTRINDHARIALCGNVSQYNADEPYGITGMRYLLVHRVSMFAFVIADHREYWPGAIAEIGQWVREGKVRYREDIAPGLHNAPKAFIEMLTGRNFGKQLVEVAAS